MDKKTTSNDALCRRAFLTRATGAAAGATALMTTGFLGSPSSAKADTFGGAATEGDLDILRFLAAAELIEDDLWQQYCELATDNQNYKQALKSIDRSLPRYICDDRDNERSHHQFINAYLVSQGQAAVNLDAFRTLPSSSANGAQQTGRLTNLMSLTVDTSWYFRYRSSENPDFGATFPQVALIQDQPTIPVMNRISNRERKTVAMSAAFHFAAIEQGGASLYASLMQKVTNLDVLLILASIGPVEFYQFAAFHKVLENIKGNRSTIGGTSIPNLRNNQELAQAILPEPCTFLRQDLPLSSVLRPSSTAKAGAVAAATSLVESGLFEGQSPAFFTAVTNLATAADSATRTCAQAA